MRSVLVFWLLLVPGLSAWAQADLPPANFTIAFIGDQGLGANAQAVLNVIAIEGADAVIHSGDFEYLNNPLAWDDQINATLGPNFPYFASAGNHDAPVFYGPGGYQEFMMARMNQLGLSWQGDPVYLSHFHSFCRNAPNVAFEIKFLPCGAKYFRCACQG